MARYGLTFWLHKPFWLSWWEQQKSSWNRISWVIEDFIIFFPLGIIESFVYLLVAIITAPLVFSRGLYYWLRDVLFSQRDERFEDFANQVGAKYTEKVLRKRYLENQQLTKDFLGKSVPFVLGIIATLLTLFLTNKIKSNP